MSTSESSCSRSGAGADPVQDGKRLKLPEPLHRLLACPICKFPLTCLDVACICTNELCRSVFPIVEGVPVLINERNSVFRIKNYYHPSDDLEGKPSSNRLRRALSGFVPSLSHNWVAARNFARLAALLTQKAVTATTVLVVGAGELGEGIGQLLASGGVVMIETDVYFGPNIVAIADGHDLPFLGQSFDAVVVQAVLEHVIDPVRCVAELYRVLKPGGYVYAESPFLFPVHLGAHDFWRFSSSAHRRLFRDFTAIDSGICGGPGQALALAIRSFVLSWSPSSCMQTIGKMLLPFFIFWLKYCDSLLITKPHAEDFASTFYFLGEKSEAPVSDREILEWHWSNRLGMKEDR